MRSKCENGLKFVEFSTPKSDVTTAAASATSFKFDPATNESFGFDALVPDPLETILVKVGPSKLLVAGEGVYAEKDIPEAET